MKFQLKIKGTDYCRVNSCENSYRQELKCSYQGFTIKLFSSDSYSLGATEVLEKTGEREFTYTENRKTAYCINDRGFSEYKYNSLQEAYNAAVEEIYEIIKEYEDFDDNNTPDEF